MIQLMCILCLLSSIASIGTVHGDEWAHYNSYQASNEDILFKVELYDREVVYGAPFYIRHVALNISSSDIPYPRIALDFPHISFEITNSLGERIPIARPQVLLARPLDTTRVLAPGDSVMIDYDLSWYSPRMGPTWRFKGLPPGLYEAKISLCPDINCGSECVSSRIILPTIGFEIIEPTGDSLQALNLLIEALKNEEHNPTHALECYDSLFNHYSMLPYDDITNQFLIEYRTSGLLRNTDDLITACERYFLRHHNTPASYYHLTTLVSMVSKKYFIALVRQYEQQGTSAIMNYHINEHYPWVHEETKK